jgi:outer membrane protein assembly factor BamD (BamD/ComL family)
MLLAGVDAAAGQPVWLTAAGNEAWFESASPEAAMEWSGRLEAEGSHAAASRSFENLARRWPGAGQVEAAMLNAARCAVAAQQFDRAFKLVLEMRARWPEGARAVERDEVEVEVGEARLAAVAASRLTGRRAAREVKAAFRVFAEILKRDRAGPVVERAVLGRARAQQLLGRPGAALETIEKFLAEFPRSSLVPEARRMLAEVRSGRARERSPEFQVLAESREAAGWALDQAGQSRGGAESERAIRETYRHIAFRQAELKMEEARLYVRMGRPAAAEWVLRSILRSYGDTPSARRAADLLEELADR